MESGLGEASDASGDAETDDGDRHRDRPVPHGSDGDRESDAKKECDPGGDASGADLVSDRGALGRDQPVAC
ncbi:hypothetical protein GCM10025867_49750 (plasmid) [Frondihabitans sucicola]|uniref:Uncharacterized protein n=1 Tax=Frondihabitans sucicola TaxID=1268041 RepID=A0ABM8GWG9_9MICO|nr:hypothetical protein GCM10025867_49750 [Frondihabitans sucicola]